MVDSNHELVETLEDLKKEIEEIKKRNERVELDKAWEISWTRRLIVALFTYLSVSLYLNAIQIPNPWQSAVVPTVGFLLSTLTLPFFKNLWSRFKRGNP